MQMVSLVWLAMKASLFIRAAANIFFLIKLQQPVWLKAFVFPTPNKKSKGILICTTTHGNTFIGPNAQDMENKEDTAVTLTGMDEIMNSARN